MTKPTRKLPSAKAMIVAPQPEAAHTGAEILSNGGNAMDAAIACALTQGVVDPLMCGIGGFGLMQVYDPVTQMPLVWTGMAGCPEAATDDMWADLYMGETSDGFGHILKDFVNECGATAVCPPPILDLMKKAHQKLGKLPWADLFYPAIQIAREGWIVRPHNYAVFTQNERKYGRMNYGEKLSVTEEGRQIYLNKDGSYKLPGSLIQNRALASTLEMIATKGADVFYRGALGDHIVSELRKNGSIVSRDDFLSCVAEESNPISVDYRGRQFSTVDAPGGGLYVAQALRVLERFDLVEMGHNSPEYVRVLAEVMKIATKDKDTRIADPRFFEIPQKELLSDGYADECAEFILNGGKVDTHRSGHLESKHTTHVSCVDDDGLVVSLTHSLGNPSGFIAEDTGLILNGSMAMYDPRPGRTHSIAPRKRRLSSMCPSIIFEDGKPVMTLGAPGASWIGPAVLQVTLNVLDWGMDMQEAITAPRIVATSNVIDISNRISKPTEKALVDMEYEVRRSPLSYAFAGVHGISMWPDGMEGGADPQRDGMAVSIY